MANIKIPDLPEVVTLQETDLFVVETSTGTKKLKKKNLITDTTVDPEPIEGSDNPVASGGVYTALLGKENIPVVFTGAINVGGKRIVFTDDIFKENDKYFTLFTNNEDAVVTSAKIDKTNGTLTIEILEAMSESVGVMVRVYEKEI